MPTDREKKNFVRALVANDLGRIVVCNVLDGYDNDHFKQNDVKQYFDWWIDLCLHLGCKSANKILSTMSTMQNGKYPEVFKSGVQRPDFLFQCPKRPRKQRKFEELCTVLPAFVLRDVIDDTTRNALKSKSIHFPATYSNDWTDDFVKTMMDIPACLRTSGFGPGKSIGRSGNIWITGKPIFDEKLNGHDKPANHARDVLGLVHRKSPDVLVAFHFPWVVTDRVRSARPTFMDAGANRRFRAQTGAWHRRRMAAWGHTVDLERVSAKAKNIEGLPERVCGKVDSNALAPTGVFGFVPLGRVTTERGHGADIHGNDAAFAKRLANGRTDNQLANALLGIIV